MEAKAPATRATIRTVAADAGVSVPAVSKVLRNAYGVSEALRTKVEASIAKLGYRPNVSARAMRGKSFIIGVLLVDVSNPFFPQILDGVNEVLGLSNYRALLGVGQSQSNLEASLIESMISHQMDGLILVAPQMHGKELERFAKQIPMVVLGHHEATATDFDTVNSDDQEGASIAVSAFISRGITNIAMLSIGRDDPDQHNVETHREIGFRKAMKKAGLATLADIWRCSGDTKKCAEDVFHLLQTRKRPRGLFCWSDLDAVHAIDACAKLGVRVPEDLAIIGYDNSSVAALSVVNLASIDQSGQRLGRLATETLLARINGRNSAIHLLVEPNLVVRRSLLS
jgi:LacI family transcriptional regulator